MSDPKIANGAAGSDVGSASAVAPSSPPLQSQRDANGSSTETAVANAERRAGGRVHWDTSAPIRRQRGQAGTTVTIRSPPNVNSSSVQRVNHPGTLSLSNLNNSSAVAQPAATVASPSHQPIPALTLSGAKALDEQGLDSRAFLELQRELQRHETSTISSAAENAPAEHDAEALEEQDQATDLGGHVNAGVTRRRRYVKPGTPDWSSGATTPVTDTTSDSGSYDAANDSDLNHIELIPGETDGMPSRQRRTEEAEEQPRGWARLRSVLLRSNAKDEEDEVEAQRGGGEKSYENGGPTNTKSVPVVTSTGVHPAGPRSRASKYEKEAARLIRAHKVMTGQRMDDDVGAGLSSSMNARAGLRRDHLDSGLSTPDALDTAANMSAKPVASGGVLGNLLKLYEQQQREERLRRAQQAERHSGTSPLSTPGIDMGPTGSELNAAKRDALDDALNAELERQNMNAKQGANRRSRGEVRRKSGLSTGSSPGWTASGIAGGLAGASKKAVAIAANQTGLDTLEDVVDERPKASRSSAGVFGALVATTGNLVGAVSPWHAQLGPNPKRPGYTLDRYLLPEMNAKTLKRTAEIVADAAPRPLRSRPPTPGHHSPSTFMRKETNDSNETHAATPPSGGQTTPKKSATRPSSLLNVGAHSRKNSTQHHLSGGLHLPHVGSFARTITGHSNVNTPDALGNDPRSDYFGSDADEQLAKQEWQRKLRKRAKDKRKKEEIFITMHVAAILQRQEFLLKLSRALMMFGAPTHRIETQIQQTARVLDINCRCIYLPNLMLFAFGDETTHTSEMKFIKQPGGLDLTKLTDMHSIYWNVIHDKIGVDEASRQLDVLMRRKPFISKIPMIIIGGFCSSFICVGTQGFGGSFVDALVAFPLGMFLVFSQMQLTQELFSNVFEILFAAINSFAAAGLASTKYFCYGAVVSGSIVLILPGFLVLTGALELQSKNLIAGSVRLVYAIIYSLFLGIGISIGSSFWVLIAGESNASQTSVECSVVHADLSTWWGIDPSPYWAFLTVPGYACALSLRNQAKFTRKEYPVMVLIAICGWAVNHFASTSAALNSRSDVTSALGALTVGLLSNVFGRVYDGKSYTVAAVGVLYQLPSGLSSGSNGSLLNFANTSNTSSASFNSGFQVAQGLVEVALGLTVGLYAATVLAYIFGGRKVRGGGLFSF